MHLWGAVIKDLLQTVDLYYLFINWWPPLSIYQLVLSRFWLVSIVTQFVNHLARYLFLNLTLIWLWFRSLVGRNRFVKYDFWPILVGNLVITFVLTFPVWWISEHVEQTLWSFVWISFWVIMRRHDHESRSKTDDNEGISVSWAVRSVTDIIDDNVRLFKNVPYVVAALGLVVAGKICSRSVI